MIDPEYKYEDKCIWLEERRFCETEKLTKNEMYLIKCDEYYDEGR